MMKGRRYVVHGRVQGVSFRWFTKEAALRVGVGGWVRNRRDGTVEAEAWGSAEELAELEENLRRGPAMSRVDRLDRDELSSEEGAYTDFEIRATA